MPFYGIRTGQLATDVAKNKRHISVFALVTALRLMGDSMLYTMLPVYFQQAGLTSLWEVGVVLSVNRLVRLPLNPFIGRLYIPVSVNARTSASRCCSAY